MLEVRTLSPNDTLALGRRLASLLHAGDLVLLSGRLGSGKTLFVSGLAEGLGIEERVLSPSFVIVKTYEDGFVPLIHADVYRLGSMAEFEDLELAANTESGVVVIEWGEAIVGGVPEDHLGVSIEIEGETERTFRFDPHGSWLDRDLSAVA
jgi:tRNA threonylcarbamoyladenosine biosynthesis protein TsaE